MKNIKTNIALAGVLTVAMSGSASAAVLFMQDFESGLGSNEHVASSHKVGGSRVANDNWGRHDSTTNPWLSDGLSGYVMGHVGYDAQNNYHNYGVQEQSIYTVQLDLSNVEAAGLQLMFDYDSWIYNDDIDGFSVIAYTGPADTNEWGNGSWDLLNPNGASDMQYETLNDFGGGDGTGRLDNTQNGEFTGFNGSSGVAMHGVAMFDLSGFAGSDQVNLRFAFGSGSYSFAEGINIDNIKITGECISGSAPDCDGGGSVIPEPGSLALGLVGLAALYRKRKN